MITQALSTTWTSLSCLLPSRIWGSPEGRKLDSGIVNPLKHLILDLSQVEFWVGQDAEKEVLWTGERLKRRFLDVA
jgi:hypothetical protein